MTDHPHPLKHGTRYAFETHGCPCAVCREAHARWVVVRRLKYRSREAEARVAQVRERLLAARAKDPGPKLEEERDGR